MNLLHRKVIPLCQGLTSANLPSSRYYLRNNGEMMPLSTEEFGISSVEIFYFPLRYGKILRTYDLKLRKNQTKLRRNFFFPT